MKTTQMTDEVRGMIELRHSAERRGEYSPLGRLLWMQTVHGTIQFPSAHGEPGGPDLALTFSERREGNATIHSDVMLVLGEWRGLPPLRVNSTKQCPKCLHPCDVCDGSGKKLCELCGGQRWLPGKWLPCPASGCTKETGNFKPDCGECKGTGQIPERVDCEMCDASGKMRCPRCKGGGKFATGRANGSISFELTPKCKACDGTCCVGKWVPQSLAKFTNARLQHLRTNYLALGPVREFGLRDFETQRTHIFEVSPDGHGDMLMLLVPEGRVKHPKAFLVGGAVRALEKQKSAMGA